MAHPLTMSGRSDTLPRASSLWSLHRTGDLLDCYPVGSSLAPREAAARGLALPGLAAALLRLRNRRVRPFGLKTGAPDHPIFPTGLETETEIIPGTHDRHLNFRIGLIRGTGRNFLSTRVHLHDLKGGACPRRGMRFPVLILRGAVRRMAG